MLLFAVLVAVAAYASVDAAQTGTVTQSVLLYGAGLAGLFGLAHLVVRWLAPYA